MACLLLPSRLSSFLGAGFEPDLLMVLGGNIDYVTRLSFFRDGVHLWPRGRLALRFPHQVVVLSLGPWSNRLESLSVRGFTYGDYDIWHSNVETLLRWMGFVCRLCLIVSSSTKGFSRMSPLDYSPTVVRQVGSCDIPPIRGAWMVSLSVWH